MSKDKNIPHDDFLMVCTLQNILRRLEHMVFEAEEAERKLSHTFEEVDITGFVDNMLAELGILKDRLHTITKIELRGDYYRGKS